MSRGVGPYQEHILAVLADHGRPMTEQEIVTALTPTGEQPSRDLSQPFGHWAAWQTAGDWAGAGPLDRAEDVGSDAVPSDGGGHRMTSMLRALALIDDG